MAQFLLIVLAEDEHAFPAGGILSRASHVPDWVDAICSRGLRPSGRPMIFVHVASLEME